LKLALEEPGSEETATVWREAPRTASSTLAYAEGRAALALARRVGRLPDGYELAVRSFESLFASVEAIDAAWEIVRHAGDLAEGHALRGYDAVHLASALSALGDGDLLVTWDGNLAAAGRATGLAVVGANGEI